MCFKKKIKCQKCGEKTPKEEKEPEITKIRSDSWIEKEHYRTVAAASAKEIAFVLFDVYKKAHGMPSYT